MDSAIETILTLHKKNKLSTKQAMNLIADTMTLALLKQQSVSYNKNTWTYTTTWDESISASQEQGGGSSSSSDSQGI
mgnify:FL=1